MTDNYGMMPAPAGNQRDVLAALIAERDRGGIMGAPQPGVPTPSAAQPAGRVASQPTMPQGQPAAAGVMPPPTGAMGPIPGPAALPLPGVTPGGGQPGQPLPLRY